MLTPGEQGLTVWFTGLSGAGKSTISIAVQERLRQLGVSVELLDGDVIRRELCGDLGFSRNDRNENLRRITYVAQLLARNGVVVLVSVISPYRETRDSARSTLGKFIEVYVNASLEACEARDPKGLYKRARLGLIKSFTGIDDPYEPPLRPELTCNTECESVQHCVDKVLTCILQPL